MPGARPGQAQAQASTTHTDLLGRLGHVPRPLIWFGLFGAPVAWLIQIDLGLAFAALGCRSGDRLPVHLLNVAAVAVTLAGLGVTFRLRGLRDQPEGPSGRVTHFLGRFGLWHNAVFLWMVGMTALSAPFLAACPVR